LPISSSSNRVSQPELADALGLTARRVRQLVSEHILPDADDDGRYDFERCQRFYRLYSTGTESAWNVFYEEVQDMAARVDRLVRRATADSGSRADLAKAGHELAKLHEAVQFMVAVKSSSDAERSFIASVFDRFTSDAFAGILRRAGHFVGADLGLTDAEVERQIAALRVSS
jgi:hypothetical protein